MLAGAEVSDVRNSGPSLENPEISPQRHRGHEGLTAEMLLGFYFEPQQRDFNESVDEDRLALPHRSRYGKPVRGGAKNKVLS